MRTLSKFVAATVGLILAAGCAFPGVPSIETNPPAGRTGPSAGCGTTTEGPITDGIGWVATGAEGRRYTYTIPPNHTPGTNEPVPLVFDFHGLLEGIAGTHPGATEFSAKANEEGFVVVFPIGSFDGLLWNVLLNEDNPDLKFIDDLVAKLDSTLCIDRSRMYVTGLSYGAMMSSMLMCMRPNTFAAAAPVAGLVNACTNHARKIPVLTFHGMSDAILHPAAGFGDAPAQIAEKYGCATTPTVEVLEPNPDLGTGGSIEKNVWDCSAVDTAVESYVINGGGHSWPGSEFFRNVGFIVGPTANLKGTDVIWEFFTRFSLDD